MPLTVMCGLSFSGKSTFARLLAAELDAEILSLDAINSERGLDGGQGIPLAEWATTNDLAHERARTLLESGREVLVDDTGSPRFIRDAWRETAQATGSTVALVWMRITPDRQRDRVVANRRSGERPDVTDAVLDEHSAGFEPPTADEHPIVVAAGESDGADAAGAVAAEIRRRALNR